MIDKYNDLKEVVGMLDPEWLTQWHYSVVFRMNYYDTCLVLMEKRYERIELEIPSDDYMYNHYKNQFDLYYEYWLESNGKIDLWNQYKELEEDIRVYQEAQNLTTQQVIGMKMNKATISQLNLPFP